MKYKTRDKDYTNWPDWAIEADKAGKQVYGKAWDDGDDAEEGYLVGISQYPGYFYRFTVQNKTNFIRNYDHFEPTEEKPKKYRVKSVQELVRIFIEEGYEVDVDGFTYDDYYFNNKMFDYCGKDVAPYEYHELTYIADGFLFTADWVEEY